METAFLWNKILFFVDEFREINCHLCFSKVSNAADGNMRSTRDIEGNGRKDDEYKPMDEMDKNKSEVQAGLTLV